MVQERNLELVAYLRGRALQEWNLLSSEDYDVEAKALSLRIDQGSLMVAVQDLVMPIRRRMKQ